ncbi:MAG: hypothetical protein COA63_010640 [Methylophaga sp.]|nr:hypothetical protein [Methylophaga sp.]
MKKITLKQNGTFEHVWLDGLHNIPSEAVKVTDSVFMQLSQNTNSKQYDPVTKDVSDYVAPFILLDAQSIKIDEINILTAAVITGGFISDALGSDHSYQSQQEDQLNLSGLHASGGTWPFKCSNDAGATWSYINHSNTQFQTAVNHGITHKLGALQTGEILKAQVYAAANQAEIDAIVWP